MTAKVEGEGLTLAAFGSGNPITAENYTKGAFTSYRGRAMAILRSGFEAGTACLTIEAEGLDTAEIVLKAE